MLGKGSHYDSGQRDGSRAVPLVLDGSKHGQDATDPEQRPVDQHRSAQPVNTVNRQPQGPSDPHTQRRDDAESVNQLLAAEKTAPQIVRSSVKTQSVVDQLLARERSLSHSRPPGAVLPADRTPFMTEPSGKKNRVLYWIMCGAPPALDWPTVLDELTRYGWDVGVVPTPTAALWLDTDLLAERTGHPVRSTQRLPIQTDEMPNANALLIAPATFNTINKWAAGISDTFALGLLNELLTAPLPNTVAVYYKTALSGHPAYKASTSL